MTTAGKCITCDLDYEIANDAIQLGDYHGVCNHCGSSVYQKRIIARWMMDVPDPAGIHHIFGCLPFHCPNCKHIQVIIDVNCFHPVDVSQEFHALNGSK